MEVPGAGLVTVTGNDAEVPPPGAGFVTVRARVAPEACSATVRLRRSRVLLTRVVLCATPLTAADTPLTKPVPVTVRRVTVDPPAEKEPGETAVMAGNGVEHMERGGGGGAAAGGGRGGGDGEVGGGGEVSGRQLNCELGGAEDGGETGGAVNLRRRCRNETGAGDRDGERCGCAQEGGRRG